jgi:hypothetical protein
MFDGVESTVVVPLDTDRLEPFFRSDFFGGFFRFSMSLSLSCVGGEVV